MNRSKFTLLVLSLLFLNVAMGSTGPVIRYADKKFHNFDFKLAIELYERAYLKEPTNKYLVKQLADCYRLLNKPAQSEAYYKILAEDSSYDPINKLYYAEALRYNQKYMQAIDAYQGYLNLIPDASVQERIDGLKKITDLTTDKGLYYLQNAAAINSSYSDFGVSFFVKNCILFSSNRDRHQRVLREDLWTGDGFLKIYKSAQSTSTTLSTPELLKGKKLNKRFHEGPATFDRTKNELYLTRCNAIRKKQPTLLLKLYKASVDTATGKLGKITDAVTFNSGSYTIMHPSISVDGKLLFFASDMKATMAQGGMDIYVSKREANGNWGEPQNLGPNINTNGDEMFPFIAADSVLYFSSNGHAGLGGQDIYMSFMLDNGNWSKPRNLGAPINTNYDDFNFIIDDNNQNGFFSSNRAGGQGDDDIYKFTRRGGMLYGQVFDAESLLPLEHLEISLKEERKLIETQNTPPDGDFCFAVRDKHYYTLPTYLSGYLNTEHEIKGNLKRNVVKIYLIKADTALIDIKVRDSKSRNAISHVSGILTDLRNGKETPFETDDSGHVSLTVHINSKYKVEVLQKNMGQSEFYFGQTQNATTKGKNIGDTVKITFDLLNNNINVAVNLKNIYFNLDKWDIRPDAKPELNKIVKFMTDHPSWEIVVSAHTDCRNTYDYNLSLSAKRASAVVDYLVSKGIEARRMIAVGYGEMRLTNKCACEGTFVEPCTEAEHAMNRRIEFRINKLNVPATSSADPSTR